MILQALITKLRAEQLAAATTATFAAEAQNNGATVAEVAGVAVAKPKTSRIIIAPPQAPSVDGERLKQATLAFQSSPFAEEAAALGWDAISLFGVHLDMHPKERLDAWGLIPLLAWTALSLTLTKMEADAAMLSSPRGSVLRQPRMRAGRAEAMPWQAHPAFQERGAK